MLVDAMSDSNSINGILEKERFMEVVVECTSIIKRVQREEAAHEGSNGLAKPKGCWKEPNSNTTERTSTAQELKVEPEKGKRQKPKI